MEDEIERLVIGVRADTAGFARDVAAMRGELDGPLANSVQRAGRLIEGSLARAVSTGKFGFDDLRRVALSAMSDIAASSVRNLMSQVNGSGGLPGILGSLAGLTSGLPGRATGGPVSSNRAYVVGERGPELFVPSSSGRIEPSTVSGGQVNVAVNVNGIRANREPAALRRTSRQVARAVQAALLKSSL